METYTILIVEDDEDIREGLAIYLKNQNYNVLKASDGIEGLEIIEQSRVHLAVVDIMMPGMDGIEMVMKLRERYEFPVILLTAKSEELDKITGLNIGADDYVTKPFAPLELLARINSQLRRYSKYLKATGAGDGAANTVRVGGLELNEDEKSLTLEGEAVKLTPLELKIITLLMRNAGRVFSAEEIYERVWNEKAITTDTIMVHIRNIREKIEINPKKPKYLKVVWGIGYKIEKQ
ncbi:MAG: response regulator transcription factor [Oscillospiraceae bacterium]|nr:response regulator transcription factor [Oscillospiraceae bacterium]